MRVVVNGETRDAAARDLAGLVAELGYDPRVVATAVNGVFAPRDARADTALKDGDAVEIVAPMKGG